MLPFTPRNKNNLIGLMLARCDGEHLGEIVVLQFSKQELIFGPTQIAARINQEQTISKDLTLWNQQGSHVLRAQTLVLPVDSTFLYVDPIYITVQLDEHAAVEEDRAGGGQPADLYRYLTRRRWRSFRAGAQALVQQAEATGAEGRERRPRRRPAGSTGGPAAGARAGAFAAVSRTGRAGQVGGRREGTGGDRGRGEVGATARRNTGWKLVAAERLERSTYGL